MQKKNYLSEDSRTIGRLREIYKIRSKHSLYQSLPDCLSFVLSDEIKPDQERKEKARMSYIMDRISLEDKNVLDIGGNTGYFTFESVRFGATYVHYYEGNKVHAEFVGLASKQLNFSKKIKISNEYFPFEDVKKEKFFDVCFCLNVVHHIGDDFGDYSLNNIDKAKSKIIDNINSLTRTSRIIVLQIGFNWKGDVNLPLFPNGEKLEMVNFLCNGIKEYFDVLHCGIAVRNNGGISYSDLSNQNSKRDDSLGEFFNRPIFILESKL